MVITQSSQTFGQFRIVCQFLRDNALLINAPSVGPAHQCSWFSTDLLGHLSIYFLTSPWSLQRLFPEVGLSAVSDSFYQVSLPLDSGFPCPLIRQFPAILGASLTWSCPRSCSCGLDALGKRPCWTPQALRIEIRRGRCIEFSLNPWYSSQGLVQRKCSVIEWFIE